MSKKDKKHEHDDHGHHHHDVTRRRFLAAGGAIAGTTLLHLPPLLSFLLPKEARAAQLACTMGKNARIPVLAVDMNGGWASGSHFIAKNKDNSYLADYSRYGYTDAMHPTKQGESSEIGIPMFQRAPFLVGLKLGLGADAPTLMPKIDGFSIMVKSNNDLDTNPHNMNYWVAQSGTRGELATLVGSQRAAAGDAGGKSKPDPRSVDPRFTPAQLNNPSAALGLVERGLAGNLFGSTMADRIRAATRSMSNSHIQRFSRLDMAEQVSTLVQCGLIRASELSQTYQPKQVDPAQDANVVAFFQRNDLGVDLKSNLNDSDTASMATIAKFLTQGYAGAGTVLLNGSGFDGNGYDSHGKGITWVSTEMKAGFLVGASIRLAASKGSSLAIHMYSDGSLSMQGAVGRDLPGFQGSGSTYGNADNDNSDNSSTQMLVYDHSGTRSTNPKVVKEDRRVGWATKDGTYADAVKGVTTDVAAGSRVAFYNYLALMGEEGRFRDITQTSFAGVEHQIQVFKQITKG